MKHNDPLTQAINDLTEINGRKVAADWSLPREVYQEMKESETPEAEEEEEEESEDEVEVKEENEVSEVTLITFFGIKK